MSTGEGMDVVGEAGDGEELLCLLRSLRKLPDMVILDISMPRMHGIEAAQKMRVLCPTVKILILTVHAETEYVSQAFSAGVAGYLIKEEADTELCRAIDKIRRGGTYRSPRIESAVA